MTSCLRIGNCVLYIHAYKYIYLHSCGSVHLFDTNMPPKSSGIGPFLVHSVTVDIIIISLILDPNDIGGENISGPFKGVRKKFETSECDQTAVTEREEFSDQIYVGAFGNFAYLKPLFDCPSNGCILMQKNNLTRSNWLSFGENIHCFLLGAFRKKIQIHFYSCLLISVRILFFFFWGIFPLEYFLINKFSVRILDIHIYIYIYSEWNLILLI